jgi:hypothetical protein
MGQHAEPISHSPIQGEIKGCDFLRHCVTGQDKGLEAHDFGRDAGVFPLRHACVTVKGSCVTPTRGLRPRVSPRYILA